MPKNPKRILFVEDNELLLQLYEMMLEEERDEWATTLATNGQSALELIRQAPFDVVVSDMHMPGMSGIELLQEVRRLHPQTSRIILSGVNDQAEVADALNSTHLFLPKPFDVISIKAALARINQLDAYLNNHALRELAGKMRKLPSFPTLYLKIVKEIESPHSSIHGIAKIIATDPGLTVKILQVANSAAMGQTEPVSDTDIAIQVLGLTTVKSLVLSAQVYANFTPTNDKYFSADSLWLHLIKCGTLAQAIMRREGASVGDCEEAFTAGMLHDIGRLMLAHGLPEEFQKAVALAELQKIPQAEAELAIFGTPHTGLAAYLFGLWGLPAAIVEAVAFHQTPEKSGLNQFTALTALHVANALSDPVEVGQLNLDYLEKIGMTHRLDDWRETAANLYAEQLSRLAG